jgi:hypothetical protein
LNRSRPTTSSHTVDAPDRGTASVGFWSAWRWWLPPATLALTLALIFVDPFIGDWDGLDYTVLALRGQPSSMALGRTLFIFTNRALYELAHALFGLRPEHAYLLFKYMVVAESPLAIIACWQLARDLTGSLHASTIAALLLAVSPVFIIYSGQVMTDVPSVLLLALALIIHLRGLREGRVWMVLAGAALLGAAVNVRETVAFYAPWLVVAPFVCGWKFKRREIATTALACAVFLLTASGIFAYLFIADVSGFRGAWHGWRESMRAESARHPVMLRNALPFIIYFFAVAPMIVVALPVAAFKEWRAHRFSPLLTLALVGLWANLLLFFNYSTTVNWRYFLTGLPALAPLVACYFLREQTAKLGNVRRAFVSVVLGIAFISIVFSIYMKPTSREHIEKRALTKDYGARLKLVPRDAVMIAGAQTVAVTYWRGIGAGSWETIGTGGGWPGAQLTSTIEAHLNNGRRVFLDADPRWWSPCGWQREEIRELIKLESRFRFRRISDTLYEIKPLSDETANDAPDLQSLLPENRSDELKKCAMLDRLS